MQTNRDGEHLRSVFEGIKKPTTNQIVTPIDHPIYLPWTFHPRKLVHNGH